MWPGASLGAGQQGGEGGLKEGITLEAGTKMGNLGEQLPLNAECGTFQPHLEDGGYEARGVCIRSYDPSHGGMRIDHAQP